MSHPHVHSDPRATLTSLIRVMTTLTVNLDPVDGVNRRVAMCLAEELRDMMEEGNHWISMFKDTLSSATGRLCLGGMAGPSLLDASAALFELAQTVYSIPQAPPANLPTAQHITSRGNYTQHSTQSLPSNTFRQPLPSSTPYPTQTQSRQSPTISSGHNPRAAHGTRHNDNLPSKSNSSTQYSESPKPTSPIRPPTIRGRTIPRPYLPQKQPVSPKSQQYEPPSATVPGPYNGKTLLPLILPYSSALPVPTPPTRRRHNFSTLPNEVLELIILFSQPPTYSNRLQHNVYLSLVCKSLDRAARKKLRGELHITKPFQLEKLDSLIQNHSSRLDDVTFLTIELNIDDLRRKQGSTWYGNHFQSVINHLAISVERVSIALKDSFQPLGDRSMLLNAATAGNDPIYEQFPNVKEMRLYFELSEVDMRSMLRNPLNDIRILYIDSVRKTPVVVKEEEECEIVEGEEEIEIADHPWRVLSLPGVTLSPRNIVDSLSTNGSQLEHLDCTLRLPETVDSLGNFIELFDYLAPTLSYLSLQLVGKTPATFCPSVNSYDVSTPQPTRIWIDLCRYLTNLVNLTTLNLSVLYIHSTYVYTLLTALSTLPDLVTLRLLSYLSPSRGPLDLSEDLIKALTGDGGDVEASFPKLKYLGVLVPPGRDRICWEVLQMGCTLKKVDLQVIG